MSHCVKVPLAVGTDPVHSRRPSFVDQGYWFSAGGEAYLCRWPNDRGEIIVTAKRLIPQGVYTVWFNTVGGVHPAAPTNIEWPADGFDPNRAIVDKNGNLYYYIAHLNYDPFTGYPAGTERHAVTQVILAYHTDGTTHGQQVGPHTDHLVGAVPKMG